MNDAEDRLPETFQLLVLLSKCVTTTIKNQYSFRFQLLFAAHIHARCLFCACCAFPPSFHFMQWAHFHPGCGLWPFTIQCICLHLPPVCHCCAGSRAAAQDGKTLWLHIQLYDLLPRRRSKSIASLRRTRRSQWVFFQMRKQSSRDKRAACL